MHFRARDLLPLLVVALAVAWVYWRPLFTSGMWLPAGGGDLASLIYPNYVFASESLRRGEMPFWNPYIQSGTPFVADIQSGVLYPVNLFVFWLVPAVTYRLVMWMAVGHVWLAGAFAYVAGRSLGQSRIGATAAGVAYALSDFFVVHIGNLNLIAVAAWLPLILVSTHHASLRHSRLWIGVGSAAIAMATLAGHAQPLLFGLVIAGLIALVHMSTLGLSRRWKAAAKSGFVIIGMTAIGLAAAAVQLIPSAELTGLSVRAAIPFDTSTEYSLAPEQLISFLVPGFFGRGPDAYWGQWLRTEAGYVGILPLVFAGFAVGIRQRSDTRMLAAIGIGGLLLALGGYTAVHSLLYQFVPLFGSLRAPARAIVIVDLAISLLAGLGLTLLIRPFDRRMRRYFIAFRATVLRLNLFALALVPVGLVLFLVYRDNPALPRVTGMVEGWIMFAIWLSGAALILRLRGSRWVRPITLGGLAIAWMTLDLVTQSQGLEQTRTNPALAFDRPAVVDFLRSQSEPWRIDTDTGVWDIWQPNTAMVRRLPDVVGGIHPLELADFRRYWSELGSRSTPLYDLLNARYLLAKKNTPLDETRFRPVFDADPAITVWENRAALPRVSLVGGSVVEPNHNRVMQMIHANDFDPRQTVVVESGPAIANNGGDIGTARIIDYQSSRLSIEIAPTQPSYLLLSEVWYPGWRARIDGRPVDIRRANFLFRAVPVQPGDRRVEMTFEPSNWTLAIAMTIIAWLSIGTLIALGIRSNARHPAHGAI